MARRGNIHTVYHQMEEKGYFEANPANRDGRNPTTGESTYEGPVQFPKMFYHPQGQQKVTVPAEIVVTPLGPQRVGEQKELIFQIAKNQAEAEALQAAGWWDHPGKAIRARLQLEHPGMTVVGPELGPEEKIRELEAELALMRADVLDKQAGEKAKEVEAIRASTRPPIIVAGTAPRQE